MLIRIKGIAGDPHFHDAVAERVRSVLERAGVRAGTASVTFTDENGPKGGPDIRCALVVGVPGRGTVRIADVASSHDLAFNQSLEAFERGLTERQKRRRALARRPKKYFVAKRLLSGETRGPAGDGGGARSRDSRP
jgi:hypothetical protein